MTDTIDFSKLPVGSYRDVTPQNNNPNNSNAGSSNTIDFSTLPQGSYRDVTSNNLQTNQPTPESQGAVKQADGTYRAPTFGEGLFQSALGVGKAGINTIGDINRGVANAFTPQVQNFIKSLAPEQFKAFNELYAPQTAENQAQQGGMTAEKVGEFALPLAETAVNAIENAPKAIEGAKNLIGKAKELISPNLTSDEQVGKIIQGKLADIPAAKRTFNTLQPDINPAKMEPAELSDAIQTKIDSNMSGTSKLYAKDTNLHPMSDFVQTTGTGKSEVKMNYIQQAIDQLKAQFLKVNNQQGLTDILALEEKANTTGLTSGELDKLAKLHGTTINAFNANGEAASGLSKQAAENTRSGVKATARDMLAKSDPQAAAEATRLDRETADAIKTKDLLDKQVEKGNTSIQKHGKPNIINKFTKAHPVASKILGKGLKITAGAALGKEVGGTTGEVIGGVVGGGF